MPRGEALVEALRKLVVISKDPMLRSTGLVRECSLRVENVGHEAGEGTETEEKGRTGGALGTRSGELRPSTEESEDEHAALCGDAKLSTATAEWWGWLQQSVEGQQCVSGGAMKSSKASSSGCLLVPDGKERVGEATRRRRGVLDRGGGVSQVSGSQVPWRYEALLNSEP
ncbi:hypothetical protein DQ04_06611010 [Trypanosoma grayi]|uniref:hypothetical protein n=1 Tax=Trypanosoma grayi TaxID=71804 RepID=UPI0004F46262|nr:hypothetical protein DQ04_06611010 [Trypanosoma grayi]KEG08702.1 hypothetical protein DQ04_06611010 [Trypanosoma grayi]